MVERSPSALTGRAGPGTRAPVQFSGAPPGGRSLESFSSKNFASFKTPSKFETVRPINITKIPNRIPTQHKEISFSPKARADIFKPLTPEIKSAIKNTAEKSTPKPKNDVDQKKGSERFSLLRQTKEYKIGRNRDVSDKQIAKQEVANMTKVVEAAKPTPTKPEAPKPDSLPKVKAQENLLKLPKYEINPSQQTPEQTVKAQEVQNLITEVKTQNEKIKSPNLNKLPEKGSLRFHKNSELLKRYDALKKNEATKKPVAKPEIGSTQTKKTEIIANLLKPQQISLAEITKIEQHAKISQPKTDTLHLLDSKNKTELTTDVTTKITEQKTNREVAKDIPAIPILAEKSSQRKTEWIKKVLQNQQASLAEITTIKSIMEKNSQQPENSTTQLNPNLKTPEDQTKITATQIKNTETVQKAITELNPHARIAKTSEMIQKIAESLVKESSPLDLQKAKELIIKSEMQKVSELQKVSTSQEATAITEKLQQQKAEQKPPSAEQQTQLKSLTEALKNPEIAITIPAEKRTEAISLIKELTETTTYQADPELHKKTTETVKELERQLVEEKQIEQTVIELKNAGIEEDQITEIMTATIEQKKLPLSKDHLETLLQKAEITINNASKEGIAVTTEEEEEIALLLKEIKLLYIELDEKALAKRFETLFKAVEQAYQKALEQGQDFFTGAEIIDAHPKYEKEEEKSAMIQGQKINDGGHMDALAEINTAEKFTTLEHAYEHIAQILLKNRPGRITDKITNPLLTEAEIRKIPQDKPLPIPTTIYANNYSPITSSQTLTAA